MNRKPNLFFIVAISLLGLWYFYLGERLITTTDAPFQALFWVALAVPFANVLWLPLFFWRDESPDTPRWQELMAAAAYVWMGLLSLVLFCVVTRDLVSLIFRRPDLYGGAQSLVVLFFSALLFVLGNVFARSTPSIKRVRVPIDGLPREFEHFKIAQISDLHVGHMVRKDFVERVVAQVNSLGADLVAATGDIYDGEPSKLDADTEPLRRLEAREGKFYVTGNHEYYWDATAWIDRSRRLGFTPLLNRHVVLQRGKAKLIIAGIPDVWAPRIVKGNDAIGPADPARSLGGSPDDAPIRILLAHQPQIATRAAEAGYSLQLSGHTHGGQFVPWIWFARLFHQHLHGLHRLGKMWIYVSRGTGYWGPPLRLGSPSEVTLIELVSV